MSYIYRVKPQADHEMLFQLPAALASIATRFGWQLEKVGTRISLALEKSASDWRKVFVSVVSGELTYDTDHTDLKSEIVDKLYHADGKFSDLLLVATAAEKLKEEQGYDYEWADGADVYLYKQEDAWQKEAQ